MEIVNDTRLSQTLRGGFLATHLNGLVDRPAPVEFGDNYG